MRRLPLAALVLAAAACGAARAGAACDGAVAGPQGFGAPGPHAVRTLQVANPAWPERDVHVFLPEGEGAATPAPAVFFAHGFGAVDPVHYRALLEHLASRGLAAVYAPYPAAAAAHEHRYAVLWAGFEAAAGAAPLDLSRVGFVGHSFGGGATPALARRGLVERGWGERGAFLLVMAPWYVLGIEEAGLRELPDHLRAVVQVYEDERINDHRIAIELYRALGVPDERKTFMQVLSDRRGACRLRAVHTTPVTDGIRGRFDDLDRWAVFRVLDALAADAFHGDPTARALLPREGELEMGSWPDGTPVARARITRSPEAVRPEHGYRFPLSARPVWVHAEDVPF